MPTVTVGQENSVDIEIHYFGHGLPGLIHDVRLAVIEGGPHVCPWTHADQVNTTLLGFIHS